MLKRDQPAMTLLLGALIAVAPLAMDIYLASMPSMPAVAVVPRAIVRDLYSGDRAAIMLSLMGVVLGIAPIVAPIIGSNLHVWFGWQANFVLVAAYGAIALLCVVTALPETIKARNKRATAPAVVLANYRRLLQSRSYVGYVLVAAFASSGLFA